MQNINTKQKKRVKVNAFDVQGQCTMLFFQLFFNTLYFVVNFGFFCSSKIWFWDLMGTIETGLSFLAESPKEKSFLTEFTNYGKYVRKKCFYNIL